MKSSDAERNLQSGIVLSADVAGTLDEYVLAVQNVVAAGNAYLASFTFRELY